jgi:hypothetical protein
MARAALLAVGVFALSGSASAHHGFGRIDGAQNITLEGTLTGIDFVNPHAYLYFDTVGADGNTLKMRCEMRAATVLRRSGWTEEMFVPGKHVTINGHPHRDDPSTCYIEIEDRRRASPRALSVLTTDVARGRSSCRLSGELNSQAIGRK